MSPMQWAILAVGASAYLFYLACYLAVRSARSQARREDAWFRLRDSEHRRLMIRTRWARANSHYIVDANRRMSALERVAFGGGTRD